jgi:hypothetical protein
MTPAQKINPWLAAKREFKARVAGPTPGNASIKRIENGKASYL